MCQTHSSDLPHTHPIPLIYVLITHPLDTYTLYPLDISHTLLINLPLTPSQPLPLSPQVTVTGTADAVAKATRAIKDLVTKGYSKLIAGEDFQESSVTVTQPQPLPESLIRTLIHPF